MPYRIILLCAVLAFVAIDVMAQSPPCCEVKLSLEGDKTSYRAGEPIILVMTFQAYAEGYSVSVGVDVHDTIMDDVIVTPAKGVTEWKKQYMRGAKYTSDAIMLDRFQNGPVKVRVPLNNFIRFESAGRYTVRVKTNRLWVSSPETKIDLTTNDVSFDVSMMTEAEEAAEAARLGTALDKAAGWQEQTRIMTQLSYLTGSGAIPEKVKRFLTPVDSGNYQGAAMMGLFMSKDRTRVIKLLEDVFRDVSRPVNFSLLGVLSSLRFQHETPIPDKPVERRFFTAHVEPEAERIKNAYIKELVDSLGKRQGKNLNEAAYVILQNLPYKDPPADVVAKVRKILIEHFDELTLYGHEWLLQQKWDLFRDPVMIPSLEKMLTNTEYPEMHRSSMRAIALKRLTELAPQRARPFLVAELKKVDTLYGDDTVAALESKPIPEIDETLVAQIRLLGGGKPTGVDMTRLRFKSMLAAKFATNAVYDELLAIYKDHSAKWDYDSRAFLLSYISRHNSAQALGLLEDELKSMDKERVSSFLHAMTKFYYAEELTPVLEQRLTSDDARVATSGAYILSKHGPRSSRSKIEARLKRWYERWRNREFELEGVQMAPDAYGQSMLQTELVTALLNGKNWKLTDGEKRALAAGCFNRPCFQYIPKELHP